MRRLWALLALLLASPAAAQNITIPATGFDSQNRPVTTRSDLANVLNPMQAQINALTGSAAVPGSSTFVTALGSTTPRTLATRFADVVNVSDYGAKCDGVTDDTAAIQAAANAALGAAAKSNGGAAVQFPAGRCLISSAIAFALGTNSAITVRGMGMFVTELVQTGSTDGLVFTYPNLGTLTSGNGAQAARTVASPGQFVYVHDLSMVQANPANTTVGRGIAFIGPNPLTYLLPYVGVIVDKVESRANLGTGLAGSAISSTQNWASDFYIQDVGNVQILNSSIIHYDFGNGSEKDIRIVSNSPNSLGANAIQFIVLDNDNITAGAYGVSVEGNNIQGVSVFDTPMTAVGTAVSWLSLPLGYGFNGPLTVRASSIGAQTQGIKTTGVSQVSIIDNEILSSGASHVNWCGICVDGTSAAVVHGNQLLNLANTSTLGTGYVGTGIRVGGTQGQYPSVVSGNIIGPIDYGLVLDGPLAASNNEMEISSSVPETCYLDQTGTGTLIRPEVVQNVCGNVRSDTSPNGTAVLNGSQQITSTLNVGTSVTTLNSYANSFNSNGTFYDTAGAVDGYVDTGTHSSSLNLTGAFNSKDAIALSAAQLNYGALEWFTDATRTTRWGIFYPDQPNSTFHESFPSISFDAGSTGGALTIAASAVTAKVPVGMPLYASAVLPACTPGQTAYASDGRNPSEGAGAGSGTPVFCNNTNSWKAVWSGVAVTH